MANPSSNPAPKPYRRKQSNSRIVKRVLKKPKKKPQQGSWLASMVAMTVLLCSAGLIATFAWISIQFILNPEQVSWLNKLLPGWEKISDNTLERPQTLRQIQDFLNKQGQIVGQILPLKKDTTTSFLLPIFKERANCQSDCQYIVELRVYQRAENSELQSAPEEYYHLASQLAVSGPEESFVVAPIVDATDDNQGSSLPLPLSEVGRFEGSGTSSGVWFYLRGQRQQGTSAIAYGGRSARSPTAGAPFGSIAYGHIVYYNPERTHLQLMQPWTSPNGQLPQWRQVTGGDAKELVVDQTVGLEPQLRIYQVNSVKFVLNPIQLEQISLTPPALQDSDYQNALLLASNGLWTPAFEQLESLKKQRKGLLSQTAQAQMDVVYLHSQLTKTQADTSWASPSQQVLADLIDGRWEKALQVFEASPQNAQEIATLLKADGGRLWSRVEAQLRVNPNRELVQAWGALILAAKHGQERANSWLNKQSKTTTETLTYIQGLLEQLSGEVVSSKIFPTHPSQIVGAVQSIADVNPAEWLQQTRHGASLEKIDNATSLQKADTQVWYQVQVSAFHDGRRWLYYPFTNLNPPKTSTEDFFWQTLGINSDPEIQIVVWLPNGEQLTTTAFIKAVQLRDGILRLLVAADETVETLYATSINQSPPIAVTSSALEWVQQLPITLEKVYQQDESRVKAMLPRVWRALQESGQLPNGDAPDFQYIVQKLGHLPIQEIDLTGNGKPDTVLTISVEAMASLDMPNESDEERNFLTQQPTFRHDDKKRSRPRTLILSDDGQVIYTDFKRDSQQVLIAIAKLSAGPSLALFVQNARNYSLKIWSQKNQRFE
ncbi:hypothetical protein [Mastigocladopsis repens]|uniref:hypothetical protein n=1 Tax=Mastigocladopsis repens TaxID=221287 RepID=UPI000362F4F0|nr:hypothetical protein [Mastigocladopsis repens]